MPLHESGGDAGGLFNIRADQPFLSVLAQAILAGDLPRLGGSPPAPLDLAAMTIFLPTRRACRGLGFALTAASPGGGCLLPRILPLGDVDEAELMPADGDDWPGAPGPCPAIPALERWLCLTALVQKWAAASHMSGDDTALRMLSGGQAGELAVELISLLDSAQSERADLSMLHELFPEAFSQYWQETLRFLRIVVEHWPAYLAERGLCDPVERRNALLEREAHRLGQPGTRAPVIIAGSTGSVPATAMLMAAVLRSGNGAVVLPGLDLMMDERSWGVLVPDHPEHPQYGMKQLLDRLNVPRGAVSTLGPPDLPRPAAMRERLISETLRPASTTELWPDFIASCNRGDISDALEDLSLIEAPTSHDEAATIAVILREAAQTPDRTAALVTADRVLARRVSAMLKKWHIDVDDSAGEPLGASVAGRYFDLVAENAARGRATDILALLKHPSTRLGMDPAQLDAGIKALELLCLRQPWAAPGLMRLSDVLERSEALAGLGGDRLVFAGAGRMGARAAGPEDWTCARAVVAALNDAFKPFSDLSEGAARRGFRTFARAHAQTAAHLTGAQDCASAWPDENAGRMMDELFAALEDADGHGLEPEITLDDYLSLLRRLMARQMVRAGHPAHPRLHIWGPLEARLLRPDMIILGGLNEGTWPRAADAGPWLNRTMREAVGLPPPERRIGLGAHDFAQAMAAPEVILTRALKTDGAPGVPSRWLTRLKALLSALDMADALRPKRPWADWAEAIAGPPASAQPATPFAPPAPCPPVAARPRRLSVSDVERWIANPYAIHARHVLKLAPLPALDAGPDERVRGQIIHAALGRFVNRFPDELPDDVAHHLQEFARRLMSQLGGYHPHVAAFWYPRFARFAEWFEATEPHRRAGIARSFGEVKGELVLPGPAGPFTLSARADRIDIGEDGRLFIYDYKTGRIGPRLNAARQGTAPQLPLEGLIAGHGGFAAIAASGGAASVATLAYISAWGGEKPGEEGALGDIETLMEDAREGLAHLIALFDDPATPYRAQRRAAFSQLWEYDDYAHLARFDEWATGTAAEAD